VLFTGINTFIINRHYEAEYSMNYLTALRFIHQQLQPKNYVEIGCRLGISLSLSRCDSIAIDPDFEIISQIEAPTRLYKTTSDQFFEQYDIKSLLGGPIDMAFIDGLHLAEYAIRDFINVERNGHSGTVIVIDDVLPEKIEWASRERITNEWTGDVYQVISVLRQYRTDLQINLLDIEMKGMAIITGINPYSTILSQNYKAIEEAIISNSYKADSVEAIREAAKPLPTDRLNGLADNIVAERARFAIPH
jgi:predicted O-methyltransferase YrrM